MSNVLIILYAVVDKDGQLIRGRGWNSHTKVYRTKGRAETYIKNYGKPGYQVVELKGMTE